MIAVKEARDEEVLGFYHVTRRVAIIGYLSMMSDFNRLLAESVFIYQRYRNNLKFVLCGWQRIIIIISHINLFYVLIV